MAIDYLKDIPWSRWTRDERFFCSILYTYAKNNPKDFAEWIIQKAELDDISINGDWDLGFEVCFYRDFLWHQNRSAKQENFPFKRTFDLCLFSGKAIIIIEAKVCEGFTTKQNDEFDNDKDEINRLPGLEEINVQIVALASSKYFSKCRKSTLDNFDGKISWFDVADKYKKDHKKDHPLLVQANEMKYQNVGDIFI